MNNLGNAADRRHSRDSKISEINSSKERVKKECPQTQKPSRSFRAPRLRCSVNPLSGSTIPSHRVLSACRLTKPKFNMEYGDVWNEM